MEALTLRSFPRAILHVDGDSFFASCEVAKNPALKGKPVVTGKERGIASSMSYEAKARGVSRAMKLSEIRKICPDVIILPSDYETYSLYSKRMYEIVRRYTAEIEEYSIDECFADLTGMRRPNKMSYEAMAVGIKHDLDTELGMTFSVGLSINKVTAKVASKWKKPSGLTIIPGHKLHIYLERWPVEKIWGIGPNTTAYLRKFGIVSSLDFARRDPAWVAVHFSKPFQEIHRELNGGFVYPLTIGEKHDYASISKTKTFTPPSTDREYVFAQLSKNVENACIKLRRHNLFAKQFAFFLKTQSFSYHALEFKLSQAICVPQEILGVVREAFHRVFRPKTLYRATGVILMDLTHDDARTIDLFGHSSLIEKIEKVYQAVDSVSAKFGKHAVFLGSSFKAMVNPDHAGDRGAAPDRHRDLFKGETERKRLDIPYMGQAM
jgi:DNA polymerase-4/DNA polymerase V